MASIGIIASWSPIAIPYGTSIALKSSFVTPVGWHPKPASTVAPGDAFEDESRAVWRPPLFD